MIKGCLMMPFRLLGAVLIAGVIYLAWVNRGDIRRWVHRATAESAPPPDARVLPKELLARATARLDSLARGRADSVALTPKEVEAVVAAEVARRAGTVADSVAVELEDGAVTVRARVDAGRLPAATLGPLAEWLSGRQTVAIRGPVGLLRIGTGEWRIDQVVVRGLPVPKALWERLLGFVVPGARSTLTFPVDKWISGVRVSPDGVVLYGGAEKR